MVDRTLLISHVPASSKLSQNPLLNLNFREQQGSQVLEHIKRWNGVNAMLVKYWLDMKLSFIFS